MGEEVPLDRATVLSRVGAHRSELYQLVRKILDELEETAPWSALYHPPEDPQDLFRTAEGVLDRMGNTPGKVTALVKELMSVSDESMRQSWEDADFYITGIHGMVSGDVDRLRSQLEQLRISAGTGGAIPAQLCGRVSELIADLKGKFSSALMGATASIVAEGIWSGVEIETILFPEKGEEFRRNEELFNALKEVIEEIVRLPKEVSFGELLERWQHGHRVDQYALTDLASLRGRLGGLLKASSRRALYSGDYHQIRQRESLLSHRINELERLHQLTWSTPTGGSDLETVFPRLSELTLEIAAILDTGLLESLIGRQRVEELLAIVCSEKGGVGAAGSSAQGDDALGRTEGVSANGEDELRGLVPLLFEEDLRTFLELLLGAVLKRASFSVAVRGKPPLAKEETAPYAVEAVEAVPGLVALGEEPEWLRDFSDLELQLEEPEVGSTPAAGRDLEGGPPPGLDDVASEAADLATMAAPDLAMDLVAEAAEAGGGEPEVAVLTAAGAEEQLETLRRLSELLEQMQAPSNRGWNSLRLLQRLLSKHSRVPPAMIKSVSPYLHELLNALIPELESVSAFGALPGEVTDQLVRYCVALTSERITPEEMQTNVRDNLRRLLRLLDALRAATAEQLRARATVEGGG